MSQTETVIEGTLQLNGTLLLDEPAKLPAGRVQVIMRSLPELPTGHPFWDMMKSIWQGQKSRGHVPRSSEDVESTRREAAEGWEERQIAIERIQEESRRLREQTP